MASGPPPRPSRHATRAPARLTGSPKRARGCEQRADGREPSGREPATTISAASGPLISFATGASTTSNRLPTPSPTAPTGEETGRSLGAGGAERRRPRMPNQIGPHLEQRIVAFALGHPGFGPRRISAELAPEKWGGIRISEHGVRRVLVRVGLNTRSKRLALIARHRDPYDRKPDWLLSALARPGIRDCRPSSRGRRPRPGGGARAPERGPHRWRDRPRRSDRSGCRPRS
jgi:hypothetical protein